MRAIGYLLLIALTLAGCQRATPIERVETSAVSSDEVSPVEQVRIEAGFDEPYDAEPEARLLTIEGRLPGRFTFLSSNPMEWRSDPCLEGGEFRSSFMTVYCSPRRSGLQRLDEYLQSLRYRDGLEVEALTEQGQTRTLFTYRVDGRWVAELDIDECWDQSQGLTLRATSSDEDTHQDAVRLLRTVRTFSNEQAQ